MCERCRPHDPKNRTRIQSSRTEPPDLTSCVARPVNTTDDMIDSLVCPPPPSEGPLNEEAISKGVRRIMAVTGAEAIAAPRFYLCVWGSNVPFWVIIDVALFSKSG